MVTIYMVNTHVETKIETKNKDYNILQLTTFSFNFCFPCVNW